MNTQTEELELSEDDEDEDWYNKNQKVYELFKGQYKPLRDDAINLWISVKSGEEDQNTNETLSKPEEKQKKRLHVKWRRLILFSS